MDFKNIFYYDSDSPSCIKWAQERRSAKNNSWVSKKIGDCAGTFDKRSGYWKTSLNGQSFLVHRIIWEIFNGEIDNDLIIDHIDRDRSNNKIENLRVVTTAVNSRNSFMYSTNTSGFNGVIYSQPKSRPPNYTAHWREDGKLKTKSFSVAKYGEEGAFNLAKEHRIKMIEKLNNLGANYSETHGESK